MKNAYVLDDHFGDNGSVTAGMILTDMANGRFDELEKKGLVREATEKEVKAGHQHALDVDESKQDDAGGKDGPKPENKQAPKPDNKAT